MANLSDKFSTYGLSLATAQVEYLINTNTATSGSDTSAFAYGAAGQSIVAFSSSGNWVTKRVQSIVAITPQDRITLEISQDGNEWTDAREILPAFESGSNKYGMRVIQVDSVSNQLDVQFGGNGATGTNLWSATLEGFSTALTTWKWRVRVTRGNLAAGFGQVSQSAAGLVQSAGQLLGTNTNDNASAGYVGEEVIQTRLDSAAPGLTSGAATNVTASPLVLTAGDWEVSAIGSAGTNGTDTITQMILGISTTSATQPASADRFGVADSSGNIKVQDDVSVGPNKRYTMNINPFRLSTTGTTLYLVTTVTHSGGAASVAGTIRARRVR